MNLERMSDADISDELQKQAAVQKRHPPQSQIWLAAARIIHHLCREQARRRAKRVGEAAND